MPTLSPLAGRLVAVLLLLLALAAGHALVVAPYLDARSYRLEAAAAAEQRLDRYRRLAAAHAGLLARRDTLRELLAADPSLLPPGGEALVGAQLQDRLKATIEAHGGTVRSLQALPATVEGRLRRLPVRVQFQAGFADLGPILLALESEPPLLFLDQLGLRRGTGARRGDADADEALVLEVGLEAAGYQLIDEG
jgi:general secretion pathway protein M